MLLDNVSNVTVFVIPVSCTEKWTSYQEFDADLKHLSSATNQLFTVLDSRRVQVQNARMNKGRCL